MFDPAVFIRSFLTGPNAENSAAFRRSIGGKLFSGIYFLFQCGKPLFKRCFHVGTVTERLIRSGLRRATVRDDLAIRNIRARMIVRTGNPAIEIIKVADEEDASVIWMSSRSISWLEELLSGSITHSVLMNAQRPVMVIRQPECGDANPPISPP
ncbi:MAG: universal stress protein [Methanoregula sp.]